MAECLNTSDIREKEKEQLDRFVKRLNEGPDLKVNKNIARFFSLASSDYLRQLYRKRIIEADDGGSYVKGFIKLVVKVRSGPEVTGLGALGIALYIDNCSSSPPEDSMKEALRCVFAEVVEILNLITNCLIKCVMDAKNKDDLCSDIKGIECQLSAALTKLKNSMLSDGHMSSAALKAWVNGAAFHIQMLIHLVRLGGVQTCDPVERLLASYQSDLDPLFTKLREVIEAKCSMRGMAANKTPDAKFLVDENSQWHAIRPQGNYEKYLEAYYERRYGKQKGEIQQYFSEVRQNLQRLVDQRGFFNV